MMYKRLWAVPIFLTLLCMVACVVYAVVGM
jgi:hypothetical protein